MSIRRTDHPSTRKFRCMYNAIHGAQHDLDRSTISTDCDYYCTRTVYFIITVTNNNSNRRVMQRAMQLADSIIMMVSS